MRPTPYDAATALAQICTLEPGERERRTLSYTVRPGLADGTIALDIHSNAADVVALKALYAEFLRA